MATAFRRPVMHVSGRWDLGREQGEEMNARSMKDSDKLSTLDGSQYQPRNVAQGLL